MIRRRDFITLLGGAAAAWPIAARAQQSGQMRRIGILIAGVQDNQETSLTGLRDSLAKLGWIEGRNLRIDLKFGADDADRIRTAAAEIVALAPDVVITNTSTTRAVQELTRTIPIVIAQGGDPAASGLIRNFARPEGNITGFITAEPSIGSKWLELLKEAVPRTARVAIVFNPDVGPTATSYLSRIEAAAPALSVQVVRMPVRGAIDVVRAIDAFAPESNGALLILPPTTGVARDTIVQLAEQHRLPAIYPTRADAGAGGLVAYGTVIADLYRGAASYVDRLLRGEKIADLPVQLPTKFELVVNMKTAKSMGLTIPESFLLRADEIIE
jgi:putative ABC transport system substrate-binding protein